MYTQVCVYDICTHRCICMYACMYFSTYVSVYAFAIHTMGCFIPCPQDFGYATSGSCNRKAGTFKKRGTVGAHSYCNDVNEFGQYQSCIFSELTMTPPQLSPRIQYNLPTARTKIPDIEAPPSVHTWALWTLSTQGLGPASTGY